MKDTTYRSYSIYFCPKPIPIRDHDWSFVHVDYDGAPDGRFSCLWGGTGASIEDCMNQIDDIEDYKA